MLRSLVGMIALLAWSVLVLAGELRPSLEYRVDNGSAEHAVCASWLSRLRAVFERLLGEPAPCEGRIAPRRSTIIPITLTYPPTDPVEWAAHEWTKTCAC
jgi:hypothetical protein